MGKIELTGPEAGIALAVLVSLSDDNPSEEEAAVLRRYYRYEDAESLKNKLKSAGYSFPGDLADMEDGILDALGNQDREFQLRTLSVCLELAHSDGVFDQDEMIMLNRFCLGLKFGLSEAEQFGKENLKELDEVSGYDDYRDSPSSGAEAEVELTSEEAGAALAILVGFSDDDPSDEEAAVMREYYKTATVSSLMATLASAGLDFPAGLGSVRKAVSTAFRRTDADLRKKYLAIAWKVAGADGTFQDRELDLIQEFCYEFGIGTAELKDYFKTAVV